MPNDRDSIAERLHPARTALVIVDMQNDFCAPGGYVEALGKDVGGYAMIVPPIDRLVTGARAAGVRVIWLVACYDDDKVTPAMRVKKHDAGITAPCCARGSWGAAFYGGLQPAPDEPVIEKSTYSGFATPALAERLVANRTETIVFAGVQTNVCVESTLRDAHARGFYVALAEDAVASHTPPLHQATIANVRFLFGDVLTSDDVLTYWPASADSGQ